MNNILSFLFIVIFTKALFVRSDENCSCADLAFIKQLLQQEMFERKLAINKLRSELQTKSNAALLIQTEPVKDADILARVQKLEMRFNEFVKESSVKHKAETDEIERKLTTHMLKSSDLQFVVRKALQHEKVERLNFYENVQNELETANEKVSLFMKTSKDIVDEKINKLFADNDHFEKNISQDFADFTRSTENLLRKQVTSTEMSIESINDTVDILKSNMSKKLDNFAVNVNNIIDKKLLGAELILGKVQDNVTDIRKSVDNGFGSVETLKNAVSEVQNKLMEHINSSDRQFSVIGKEIGTCVGQWSQYGKKCFSVVTPYVDTWFGAKRACEKIGGKLLKIDNMEENDFILKKINRAVWLGLHDRQTENNWQWALSEGKSSPVGFTNWAPDEPNDAFNDEDCGMLLVDGQWNDYTCEKLLPYICTADPKIE